MAKTRTHLSLTGAISLAALLIFSSCSSEKMQPAKGKSKDKEEAATDAQEDDDLATDGEASTDDEADDAGTDDTTTDDDEADAGETDPADEVEPTTLNDFTTMTADELTAGWQTYGGVYEIKDASLQVTTFTGEGSRHATNNIASRDVTLIKKDVEMTDGSIEMDYDTTGMSLYLVGAALRHKGIAASDMIVACIQTTQGSAGTSARFAYRSANKWYYPGTIKSVTTECPRTGKLKIEAAGTLVKILCNGAEVHQLDMTQVPVGGKFGVYTIGFQTSDYLTKILKLDYKLP